MAANVANPDTWTDHEIVQWSDFIHKAVRGNDVDLLNKLLDEGLNANLQWPKYERRAVVVRHGRENWITLAASHPGSPLHLAAAQCDVPFIQRLIAAGADVNARSLDGSSALHESIRTTNHMVTEFLLDLGIDVNRTIRADIPGEEPVTALRSACEKKDLRSVRTLLQHGALPDSMSVQKALEKYDYHVLQLLLSYGAQVDLSCEGVQNVLADARWRGQTTLQKFFNGSLPLAAFKHLSSDKLTAILDESSGKFEKIINDLRISTATWLDQPLTSNQIHDVQLCVHCESFGTEAPVHIYGDSETADSTLCAICNIVRAEGIRVRDAHDIEWRQSVKVTFKYTGRFTGDRISTRRIRAGFPQGHLASVLARLQHCADTGTDSEGTMALARAWLHDCLKSHKKCSADFAILPSWPARLIDVGSTNQEPKLVITDDQPFMFCALSYCWGKHPFLRTTKESLSCHKQQIRLADLPRTLNDAILVCRQLSIPYIWIDALCIVQDDAQDWAQESKKMAAIYRNAILTIIAVAADDTTKGCFQPRSRSRTWPVKINDECSTDRRRLSYEERQFLGEDLSKDFWGAPLARPRDPNIPQDHLYVFAAHRMRGKGPVDERAWCTQEKFMSNRILYFADELHWECRSCYASEALPGRCDHSVSSTMAKVKDMSMNASLQSSHEDNEDSILTGWEDTVNDYAKRQITMQSDRLIALSGMASMVAPMVGSEYFAGLWSGRHLIRSLLWQMDLPPSDEDDDVADNDGSPLQPKSNIRNQRDGASIFPSWSWASCLTGDKRVKYTRWDEPMRAELKKSREPDQLAEIVSAEVGDIFTAKVIQGTIKIKGRLRCMKLAYTPPNEFAANIVRIIPVEEDYDDHMDNSANMVVEEDYQLDQSPPTEWQNPYEIIQENAPEAWLNHLKDNLYAKDAKRSEATKTIGLTQLDTSVQQSDTGVPDFGADLFARLRGLEELSIQQANQQRTPVPMSERQHVWIKDDLCLSHKQIWCLAIAFWEDVIVGLCLERVGEEEEKYRRIGLCQFERSGKGGWNEDVVFEEWKEWDGVVVCIV